MGLQRNAPGEIWEAMLLQVSYQVRGLMPLLMKLSATSKKNYMPSKGDQGQAGTHQHLFASYYI